MFVYTEKFADNMKYVGRSFNFCVSREWLLRLLYVNNTRLWNADANGGNKVKMMENL